jgi:hypothetical protein
MEYQLSTSWGKLGKFLGFEYSVYGLNRKIKRLQERIGIIENKEVPNHRNIILAKSRKKSELQRQLDTFEADIKNLE